MKNNARNRKLNKIRAKNAFRKGFGRISTKVSNDFLKSSSFDLDNLVNTALQKIKFPKYQTICTGISGPDYASNDFIYDLKTIIIHFKIFKKNPWSVSPQTTIKTNGYYIHNQMDKTSIN